MACLLPSTSFPSPNFPSSHEAGQHDVFLSFRGIDTRNNFTSHLYRSLQQKGIQTFIDNEELRRGEEISTSLIMAIKESKISIIIFSKNYASSSWCLDELVEIFKCRESLQQLVWPIFLYVDPSDVRNHRGSFGEALAQYEESSDKKKKEKLPEWKIALNKAANLSGWHLDNGIVEAALSKLNRTLLHVAKYPVGIESHLHELASLINAGEKDVRFIGIHGLRGIGKTTIAKAAFNSFADEFEVSSFLADVRETTKQHFGFVQLQELFLFDMLGDKNLKVGNIQRGINIIKERLCNKRVLLFHDDVDELDQLDTLAGGHEWFGLGSRIIITTKNKHLLATHGVNLIYEVRGMDHERALELLSWNAFKREKPIETYLALSDRVVCYADGLPLALVVLGSFLCCRTKEQWQSAIHNLEKKPDKKIYQVLKISYDALQDNEKSLFLDIACFFVGEDKDYVIKVLGSSNFCPIIGIKVLTDMSLINVESNRLGMHQLIEEVGKEVVCQESPKAGKRSRLWSSDDIFHVFSENTIRLFYKLGTNTLEGIMLKLPEQRTLYLNATSFLKMKRLQLLIFANVVLSGAIEYLPNELRLIDVPGYQFPTLSFNSGPKQLAILNMPYSHIHQLDKGFKNFERLKVLKLSYSKFLRKFPDLSTAPNVESLYVDNCTSLVEINESVGFLNKLVTLDAQCCSNLRTVPSNLVSKYFRTLNFEGCSKLQMFPNIVEKIELITSLDLSSTAIKQLPSSIDHLVALSKLRLSACKKLVNIPSTIYKLVFLDVHDLSGCKNFSTFPNYDQEIHGNFELRRLNLSNYNISNVGFLGTPFSFPLLELLDLSGNKFVSLPSISKLSKLSELSLANCQQLREIPELPGCQINIKASHYKSLVETPWEIMAKIISNDTGSLCPSRSLSFSHKSATETVTFNVPSNMSTKIAAVIICAVSRSRRKQKMELSFQLLDESDSHVGSLRRGNILVEPGNMLLIYLPGSTLLSECLPYSPFKDTKISVIERVQHIKKIKVQSTTMSTACGIHILWDGDEIMIEGKPIKVSDSISHIIDRTFDDFANGGMQFSWSSRQRQKREVSASTNIFETEELEEEEELDDIHQNRGHGRRKGCEDYVDWLQCLLTRAFLKALSHRH
ncbi:disease resistance protein RPV1-like [Ziziphus jujuba]|uniref:Disease resistance protein RPV1-like n=1 Tax=Ziziphus jujuba TaxID=326968 RepID=A0ABM4A2W9_ZIZJJ|nr:disease resistance protein RPV1-like [Ziziphus jujuba]